MNMKTELPDTVEEIEISRFERMPAPIRFRFNEMKATQVASRLVEKSGNRLSHLALMKLLYIIDREALRRWDRPVVGGKYCSMKHGTVISQVLDLMRRIEGWDEPSTWTQHLTKVGNEMRLTDGCDVNELAPAEVKLADEIFEKFGKLSKWELRDLTHNFQEWEDVGTTSKPIRVERILECVGKNSDEVAHVADDMEYLNVVDDIIAR